ncbi:MAG: PAS domain S-box protein [Limnothrix sp. RL_2_0]|nr:PAS domain S-box protein [Limnothrix sp. RL_2_0]
MAWMGQFQWFSRKSQQLSLRWVLVVPFLLQIFGVVGLIGFLSLRNGQKSVDSVVQKLQTEIAKEIDLHLQNYLREPDLANRATVAAIELGLLDPADPQALITYFRRAIADSAQINTIQYGSVVGEYLGVGRWEDGTQVLKIADRTMNGVFQTILLGENNKRAAIISSRENYVLGERAWFKNPLDAKTTRWSPVYVMFSHQMLGLTLAEPVRNSAGEITGVVGTDVLLAEIDTFLKELEIGSTGQAFILERDGTLIGSSTLDSSLDFDGEAEPTRLTAATSGDRLIQETTAYLQQEFGDLADIEDSTQQRLRLNGELYFLQVVPYQDDFGLDWLVVQIIPQSDFMGQIHANTRNTVIISLVALALASGVGIVTSRWIADPILQLSQAAIALAQGEWDVILPSHNVTNGGMMQETTKLALAFNRMRLQLQKSFDELAVAKTSLEVKVQERTTELRESELKYRSLYDNSQVGIFRTRAKDGLFVDANTRCIEILGYDDAAEVLEKLTAIDFYADVKTRAELLKQAEIAGEVRNFETQFQRKDGEIIDVLVSGRFNHEAQCLEGVINDISDRKRAERALAEKEEYLRLIINNIPQQVFWKDRDLNFQGCNRNWAIAAGIESPESVVGKTDFDLLGDLAIAEAFCQQDLSIITTGQGIFHQTIRKVKSLLSVEPQWLDMSKVPIHDSDGNVIGILGVLDDITERKMAEEILQQEQAKSEALLLNVLPAAIATQLKENPGTIAEQFPQATIMFADVVDFTPLASQLPPQVLLELLNEIFSEFDQLADQYGLEKIKTIGDAYMVAGGLPIPTDEHAAAIAEMALAMIEVIKKLNPFTIQIDNKNHLTHPLRLRIGINTGEVIAGVIGTKKFIYDLWGDAVNVASRMEAASEPNLIQVTEATYECLKDRYVFEKRGMISVKGKGAMTTYWLLGRK